MIKQIRTDNGDLYWEMWDDDGRLATITKEAKYGRKKYKCLFENLVLHHPTKEMCINHVKFILYHRANSHINKNEHAIKGVR